MIKEIKIETIDEVKDLLFEQQRNQDNGRLRSSYLYRGMSNSNFKILTSLNRHCGKLSSQLETPLLENYIKYVSIDDPTINESIWKAMIIGQHHGLPTRLLDWTHSTLVALHFATSDGNMDDLETKNTVVWRIDARELNKKLPQKYQDSLNEKRTFIFSVNHLNSIVSNLKQYDDDMSDKSFVIVEPPSIDQRIVNQYSFFTVMPLGITDIQAYLDENTENTVKYVIDKKLNWDIRDTLDQLNMNERMIYPGKDGIAKWLARHYFVKKENR